MEKSGNFFEKVKSSLMNHVRLSIQSVADERRRRAESILFSSFERQNLDSSSVGLLIPLDERAGQVLVVAQVYTGQNILFKGHDGLEVATDPRKLSEAVAQIKIDGESVKLQIGEESKELYDRDPVVVGDRRFTIRLLGGTLQSLTGRLALSIAFVMFMPSLETKALANVAGAVESGAAAQKLRILDKKVLFDLGKGVNLNIEIDSLQRVDVDAFSVSFEESGESKSLYVSKVLLGDTHTIFSVDNTSLCAHKNMATRIEAAMRQIVNQASDESLFSLLTASNRTVAFFGKRKEDVGRADLVVNCHGEDRGQNPFELLDVSLNDLLSKTKSQHAVRFIPIVGTTVNLTEKSIPSLQTLGAKVFPLSFSPLHLGLVDDVVAQLRDKVVSARAKVIEDEDQSATIFLPQVLSLHVSSPFLLGIPKSLRMQLKVSYNPVAGEALQAGVDAQPFVDGAFKAKAAKIVAGFIALVIMALVVGVFWIFFRFKTKKCPVTGQVISRRWRTNLWTLESVASLHVEDINGRHVLTCALDKPVTEIGRRGRGVRLPHVPKDFSPLQISKRPGGVYTLENKSMKSKMRLGDLVLGEFLVLAHNQVFTLGPYRVRFWAPTAKV